MTVIEKDCRNFRPIYFAAYLPWLMSCAFSQNSAVNEKNECNLSGGEKNAANCKNVNHVEIKLHVLLVLYALVVVCYYMTGHRYFLNKNKYGNLKVLCTIVLCSTEWLIMQLTGPKMALQCVRDIFSL